MYNGVGTNMAVSVNAVGVPVPNVWHHVAVVYDGGSSATLYVNGTPTTATLTSPFVPDMNGPLTLGMRSDHAFLWPGSVDEFAIYRFPLSVSEIQFHYQAGREPLPPIPYEELIQSQSPLIYLRLDEPAFPAAVNSGTLGTGADGTYEPFSLPGTIGVPLSGFGLNNFGCQFNGNSGYIDIPGTSLDLTGPVTVVAWAQAEPANGIFQTIVGKGDSSYRLSVDTIGHPRFADGQANPDVVGPLRIDDGQWHFLGGVHSNGTNYLYVDGSLAGGAPAGAPVNGNRGDVWIGGAPDYGNARIFNGVVDEVAIFPYALSPAQLQQLFSASAALTTLQPSGDISLQKSGGQLQLIWCSGILQEADNPAGPFADLPTAGSPYPLAPTEAHKFYRVKH
jgi:prepilin-type processing-associated H-X9-DG protein